MNRREFALLGAAAAVVASERGAQAQPAPASGEVQHIAMLAYPWMTALDLIGPQLFFAALGNVRVHLVWKTREPVTSDTGVTIVPTTSFADCPAELALLFVPGGLRGTVDVMGDGDALGFLRSRGARAGLVTSVCTGALVLGAAGLLDGYRATAHWYVRDLLPLFGAAPVAARVVEDRNRITGGGVTAGIDFALRIAARLRGAEHARRLQLVFEYDPQPPFDAGSPEKAGPALVADVLGRRAAAIASAREAALAAQARLRR
jgi:cyclohexyl-isocyanide hydratase